MDIGFYIINIDNKNEADNKKLECLNKLCELRPYDNIALFNSTFHAVDVKRKYYTLHISEAKYFKGILFFFDIKSILLARSFPAPKRKVLFLENIDWQNDHRFPYTFWHNIYMNEDVELISTNKQVDDLCKICWKNPLSHIENYNCEEISNVLQKL